VGVFVGNGVGVTVGVGSAVGGEVLVEGADDGPAVASTAAVVALTAVGVAGDVVIVAATETTVSEAGEAVGVAWYSTLTPHADTNNINRPSILRKRVRNDEDDGSEFAS
jgi:hypothetical protein